MATEQLWNGFDGKKLLAERAVRDEVGREIATTYAVRADIPSVYNAKLKMKLGAGSATDTGFTANAESDVTMELPTATASVSGVGGTDGLLSATDKEKLDEYTEPETSIYGDYIADESGQAVLGESGEQIISENAVVLYDTFKGVKFGAARSVADQDGNNIKATYATKEDLNSALGNIEPLLAAL